MQYDYDPTTPISVLENKFATNLQGLPLSFSIFEVWKEYTSEPFRFYTQRKQTLKSSFL